jgi:hypothetical protein
MGYHFCRRSDGSISAPVLQEKSGSAKTRFSAVSTTAGSTNFSPAYPNAEEAISKIVYVSVRVRARVLSGRLAGQAMPGFFAKEIVPPCALWGAFPQPSATLKEPVGETASRLAYTQKSSERHVHGLPCYCSSKRTESFIYSTPWMRAECRSVTGQ